MGASTGVDRRTKGARCCSRSIADSAPWRSRIRSLSPGGSFYIRHFILDKLDCNGVVLSRTLQEKYSWIDSNRTGIWGWSYGGFSAAMVLATDAESVFKCGISVAPVTSWIYYGNFSYKNTLKISSS